MATSSIGTSTIDVNSIVTGLMQIERQPLDKLAKNESAIQAKISSLGTIKAALANLQTAVKSLTSANTFAGYKTSVAGDQVVVSADSTAVAGTYSVEVQTMARAQSLASSPLAAADTVVGGGTLTLELGTYTSGTNTFTPSATTGAVSVTIGAGSTLEQVRDAINASGAAVSASLITDGTGTRLSLVSTSTGAANGFRITAVDGDGNNTDTSGLSQLAFDPTAAVGAGKNLTQTRAPTDATVVINGLSLTSSSNVLTSAIQGVTVTLNKEAPGTTAEITVARDTASAKSAIEGFVKAYNAAETALNNSMAYEPNTKAASPLNGDSTPRMLQTQLRAMLSGVQSNAATYSTLSSVGIGFARDGQISFDSAKFDAAVKADSTRVQALFTQDDGDEPTSGFAVLMDKRLTTLLDNTGPLQARTDGLKASLKLLDAQQEDLSRRLTDTEARLRKKYTALDAQLTAMQGQSTSLANALSQLPGAKG